LRAPQPERTYKPVPVVDDCTFWYTQEYQRNDDKKKVLISKHASLRSSYAVVELCRNHRLRSPIRQVI